MLVYATYNTIRAELTDSDRQQMCYFTIKCLLEKGTRQDGMAAVIFLDSV